jgi:hypothetical protein
VVQVTDRMVHMEDAKKQELLSVFDRLTNLAKPEFEKGIKSTILRDLMYEAEVCAKQAAEGGENVLSSTFFQLASLMALRNTEYEIAISYAKRGLEAYSHPALVLQLAMCYEDAGMLREAKLLHEQLKRLDD